MSGPPKRISSYQTLFNKVLSKRLKYLNNINAIVAIVASVLLNLPYGGFWWNLLLTFTVRSPIIFVALFIIKLSRDSNSTVDYSKCNTLGLQVVRSLGSVAFLKTLGFYFASSLILAVLFIFQLPLINKYYVVSTEYEHRPKVNDEWTYFWFYSFFVALIYSAQHLVFQRNRFDFTYGVSKVEPKDALLKTVPDLLSNTIVLNVATTVAGPVVYWFVRSIIYRMNWLLILMMGLDSTIPSFHISLGSLFNASFYSAVVILCWELVNHIYNVYATIGCLDGKKPISTYSSDPINTLLSGLRNTDPENQLSRLTAFQELAYIATAQGPEATKLRTGIYNAHSKGGFVWTAILDECALLIKETSSRINFRSSSDLKIIKDSQTSVKDDLNGINPNGSDIFGNSFISSPAANKANTSSIKSYDEILNAQKQQVKQSQLSKLIDANVIVPLRNVFKQLNADDKAKTNNFILDVVKKSIKHAKDMYETYHKQFLSTSVGAFFRITLKRDTESRVINPVNYGNAVIALSNLLIHAIEEDKNLTITNNHISEVLNLLERPIRACSNYNDFLPPSVFLTLQQRKQHAAKSKHLITLLHDVTMKEFFQLCVKYNYKLGDLLLSSRSFKLAKWAIDVAIAQQSQSNEQK